MGQQVIRVPCRLILQVTKYGYPDVHLQRYDIHKVCGGVLSRGLMKCARAQDKQGTMWTKRLFK